MTDKQFKERLGKAIKKAQKSARLSDEQLADGAKCSVREIRAYKAGERTMRIQRFMSIAKALNVTPQELAGE